MDTDLFIRSRAPGEWANGGYDWNKRFSRNPLVLLYEIHTRTSHLLPLYLSIYKCMCVQFFFTSRVHMVSRRRKRGVKSAFGTPRFSKGRTRCRKTHRKSCVYAHLSTTRYISAYISSSRSFLRRLSERIIETSHQPLCITLHFTSILPSNRHFPRVLEEAKLHPDMQLHASPYSSASFLRKFCF